MISNAQLSHDNLLDEEIRCSNPFFDVRSLDEHVQRLPPSLRKLLNPISPVSITTSTPLLSPISPGQSSSSDSRSDSRYLEQFQVINNVHRSEVDKELDSTPDSSDKGENDFDLRFTASSNVTSPPWSHTARSSKASSSGRLIFAAHVAQRTICTARRQSQNNETDVLPAEVHSLLLLISQDTKRDALDIFLNRRLRRHALVFLFVNPKIEAND
ncbi:hypothetical protein DFH28DRAFT_886932 [Melampsora americana]|nr:hypothetical protein DFH28DRAFT_886932 [Melampsora americana]